MPAGPHRSADRHPVLRGERLEPRDVPASASLAAGTLTVTGDPTDDRIRVFVDGTNYVVLDGTAVLGRFAGTAVTSITVNTDGGDDTVIIDNSVPVPVTLN